MTSVEIRTAPITSTIRPPRTPERMFDSGRLVVMALMDRPSTLDFYKCALGPGCARRNRQEAPQPVQDASARELAPDRTPLTQARGIRRARVVAVRPQGTGIGLRRWSGEASEPPFQPEQRRGRGQIPAEP